MLHYKVRKYNVLKPVVNSGCVARDFHPTNSLSHTEMDQFQDASKTGPRVFETFVLNSAEHENYPA